MIDEKMVLINKSLFLLRKFDLTLLKSSGSTLAIRRASASLPHFSEISTALSKSPVRRLDLISFSWP